MSMAIHPGFGMTVTRIVPDIVAISIARSRLHRLTPFDSMSENFEYAEQKSRNWSLRLQYLSELLLSNFDLGPRQRRGLA